MYSQLYVRSGYLNRDIDYLLNTDIREYDLKSAGLSLIKQFKLLPQNDIAYLDKIPPLLLADIFRQHFLLIFN